MGSSHVHLDRSIAGLRSHRSDEGRSGIAQLLLHSIKQLSFNQFNQHFTDLIKIFVHKFAREIGVPAVAAVPSNVMGAQTLNEEVVAVRNLPDWMPIRQGFPVAFLQVG
eukprot:Skav206614  [mRNA]  locus=scaffold1562:92615:93087:- [translate_table: standard]